MKNTIELCNRDLKKSIFNDIMFFSLAEGGAMGEPGGVFFFDKKGQTYHFNYLFGDADMGKVEKLFPILGDCEFGMFGLDSKVPDGWNYVNLGMGNHLIVNDVVYPKFAENLGDEDEPSVVYGKWVEIADSILNTKAEPLYGNLVCFIDKLKNDSIGEWIVDKENDGTMEHPIQMPFVAYSSVVRGFEKAVYDFEEEHPEFGLNQYGEILGRYHIQWETESMSSFDVNKLDGQGIMALIMAAVRAERFCDGALKEFFENGSIEKWLLRLKELDGTGETIKLKSTIQLISGSCADQKVDAVVNAANNGLWAGGGICGVIFKKAGMKELTQACNEIDTPLMDGDAVVTPAFNMKNAKAIIHAVGPNFGRTPSAFKELFNAYYNSLVALKGYGYHSISFPLISAGIFGGSLDNPAAESTKQCCRAYKRFVEDYPTYQVEVKLCAFSSSEIAEAKKVFDSFF
ncbi:MAG: macro domain-containing protein [Agathobacter sp.]|nr:macro domain-containing protein [Agathobacter sp.]